MARKVTVTLTDDTDDTQAADETVEFALDGVNYEIDLSSKNAAKLRKNMEWVVSAARRQGGRKKYRSAAPRIANKTAEKRAWLRANGHEVNDRGRLTIAQETAYAEAHQ